MKITQQGSDTLPRWLTAFGIDGKLGGIVWLLFIGINALLLINAILHPVHIGYDAADHLAYAKTLATEGLPTRDDTREYFSAPLAYVLPAMAYRYLPLNFKQAAKLAQLANVLLSAGTCLYLLKICRILTPNSMAVRIGTLSTLGMLPVYYRTFAYVRGEPYVVFFATVSIYYAGLIFVKRILTLQNAVALGSALGLACLARQWGFLFFPGLALEAVLMVVQEKPTHLRIIYLLSIAFLIALLICGWFYGILYIRYGSIMEFNRESQRIVAFRNQPRHFYTDLGLPELFTDPIRSQFANSLLPSLYADTWGDYWGYFIVYGKDLRTSRWLDGSEWSRELDNTSPPSWLATNRYSIKHYLGRVQAVSLLPSALMLASLGYAMTSAIGHSDNLHGHSIRRAARLLLSIILTSFIGYLVFLIMFPNPEKGDTLKPTYILHIFPATAVLVGLVVDKLRQRSRSFYIALNIAMTLVFLHNLPTCITHFSSLTSALFSRTQIRLHHPRYNDRVHTPVEIRGTVQSTQMKSYSLWYGIGVEPEEWIWISGPHKAPVKRDRLTDVTLEHLDQGAYVFRVTVELQDGRAAERYVPFTILP